MRSVKKWIPVLLLGLAVMSIIAWLVPPVYAIAKDFGYELGLLLKNRLG